MRSYSDTIFALATSKTKSALSVFRVSGKRSIKLTKILFSRKNTRNKTPTVGYFLDNKKNKIDQVVMTVYKSPKSYTGEDMLEISCHGSIAVINKINEILILNKIRPAYPGEFTKRALLNDKLNLIQAETINDLVNAETDNQRKVAVGNLTGKLDIFVEKVSKKISKLLADIEAIIDFADDELPTELFKKIKEQKKNICFQIKKAIEKSELTKKIHSGFDITLIGKPNTGKSSFINYINNKEISIVTNIPGTTTDLVSSSLDINGNKYTFVDTAGIRKHKNKIEKIGIERSLESAKKSDLCLIFLRNNERKKYIDIKNKIFVKSKYDKNKKKTLGAQNISNISGYGIKSLLKKIEKNLRKKDLGETMFSRERHIKNLNNCLYYLKKVNLNEIDISAENTRRSLISIQGINQKFDIEKILDIIFSDFCIGK